MPEGVGTFAEKLDKYILEFENDTSIKIDIPSALIELKKKKQSEELTAREVADSKFAFYMPPRGVLNNDLYDPVPLVVTSNDPQESLNLSGGHDFVSDFDLARIDERLRSLGIDPQLIDQTEIDEASTLDLSEKIEEAIEIKN